MVLLTSLKCTATTLNDKKCLRKNRRLSLCTFRGSRKVFRHISDDDFSRFFVPAEIDSHKNLRAYSVLDVHIKEILFAVKQNLIIVPVNPQRTASAAADFPVIAFSVKVQLLRGDLRFPIPGVGVQVVDK